MVTTTTEFGRPVKVVASGGLPVIQVTANAPTGVPVTDPVPGFPITLVSSGGTPMVLLNDDGTPWSA